ncbi:shikimate dehydrogenase family protein [Petrotoga miotherma]|nr:shikimate dehydrogenase [Petrotoga miotherma]
MMKKFGLLEYPHKESLSKKVFNEYFKKANIDAVYEDIVIVPDNFDDEINKYINSYDGLNVTVPFKEKVIKYVEPVEEAKEINAVNCIFNNKGYNTDWKGFYNSLNPSMLKEPIVLVGAGGASKSIIYALYKMGIKKLFLVNRTVEKAEKLKKIFLSKIDIKIESFDHLQSIIRTSKTFINATSIGMFGESFNLEVRDLSNLSLIYDIVYNNTPLQKIAKENNIKCIDGRTFWYHQGVENLKIWHIYTPEIFDETFKTFARGE